MKQEKWRPVPGYEGLYEVSNMARVRSVDRHFVRNGINVYLNGMILKQHLAKRGYHCVKLSKNGINITKTVHRFAALFIPNPNNYPHINHIDGNKGNNDLKNLEWCTHKQNMAHANEAGLIRHPSGGDSKLSKSVKDVITGVIYPTARVAAKELGISRGTLVCYLSGHRTNKTNLVYTET